MWQPGMLFVYSDSKESTMYWKRVASQNFNELSSRQSAEQNAIQIMKIKEDKQKKRLRGKWYPVKK